MTDFKELREALESISKAEKRAMDLPMFPVRYAVESVEFAIYDANQAFIAAANPAAIRSLLDRLEAAERDAERLALLLSRAEQAEDGWRIDVWISGAPSIEEITDALDAMKEQQP